MSYDIKFDHDMLIPMDIRGGTYSLTGNNEAWLNITYNYAPIFALHGLSIWNLNGKTAKEIIGIVSPLIKNMVGNGKHDADYWAPTESNAKAALINLVLMAATVPSESVASVT